MSLIIFGLAVYGSIVGLRPKTPVDSSATRSSNEAIINIESDPGLNDDEVWQLGEQPVRVGVQSSSSIVLPSGTIRQYTVLDGAVVWSDSTDGITFAAPQSTGVKEDATVPLEARHTISDPAVVQLNSNEFIMVYGDSVRQRPEVPQIDRPLNLSLARSTDGKSFVEESQVLDSARNDAGMATKPDLLYLPNGTIRCFYVSQGDRIASLISDDRGKHWIREGERLGRVSLDPDALYNGNGYILYYTVASESLSGNGQIQRGLKIRKAVSSDGLSFDRGSRNLVAGPNGLDAANPDVIIQADGTVRMYIGVPRTTDLSNQQFDLYSATLESRLPS